MAYESVEDANQQTLETLTELERRARELVNILKGGIDVGQSGTLGDLALLDTLSASPVGNAAMLRNNIGLASGATTTVGTAATRNVGTGSSDLPNTSQADGRYARLSGANDFDTMPTLNGAPIVESDSNSDGEWTRWADGTQVVTSDQFFSGVSMTVSSNGFFRSSTPEQTYPVSFAAGQAPKVSGVVNVSTSPGAFLARYGGGASGVDLELFGAASVSSIDADFTYTAVGRWK